MFDYLNGVNNMTRTQTKPEQAPLHSKRWLNSKELAALYDISDSTQSRWRKDGILPYSKIGKVIRYDRLAIDKMLEEHLVGVA